MLHKSRNGCSENVQNWSYNVEISDYEMLLLDPFIPYRLLLCKNFDLEATIKCQKIYAREKKVISFSWFSRCKYYNFHKNSKRISQMKIDSPKPASREDGLHSDDLLRESPIFVNIFNHTFICVCSYSKVTFIFQLWNIFLYLLLVSR